MNKAIERYNTKVEIPISVILETIFSDDNHDVETLCRWAKHYEFVDLIKENEKDKLGYYKLQDDYTKQSFYIWLSKEERKQYEYENYLLDKIEDLQKKVELGDHYKHLYSEVKKQKDDVVEYIKKHIQEYDVDGSPTNLDEFDFLASPKILLRMLGEIE